MRWSVSCAVRGWQSTIVKLLDPVRQKDVWDVRKAGLNILMGRRGDYKPVPGIEDVAVPQDKLADYLEKILDFCGEQEDVPGIAVYAHASAGCLHVRPLLNLKNRTGIDTLRTVGEHACDLAVKFGGAMSGEHGDGLARGYLHPRLFGDELYGAMRRVKEVFDPDNRMNPGKIIDAPPSTENLRFGQEYDTIELRNVFDWSSDFGYAGAIEMCNGAGVCRKLGAGTMCPSYIATRDEQDTTRGRANALRNVLAGRIPREELFSQQMYEVMDLCIGCKACKSECPSGVDMARIKAEFLVHYYARNGLPLFNRLMGLLPTLNGLLFGYGRPLIPLVNWSLKIAPVKALLARIGIDPRRNLPAYARQPFSAWFASRAATGEQRGSAAEGARTVILFHDTWAEYNQPEVGQAAVQVLEAAGFDVKLAKGRGLLRAAAHHWWAGRQGAGVGGIKTWLCSLLTRARACRSSVWSRVVSSRCGMNTSIWLPIATRHRFWPKMPTPSTSSSPARQRLPVGEKAPLTTRSRHLAQRTGHGLPAWALSSEGADRQ